VSWRVRASPAGAFLFLVLKFMCHEAKKEARDEREQIIIVRDRHRHRVAALDRMRRPATHTHTAAYFNVDPCSNRNIHPANPDARSADRDPVTRSADRDSDTGPSDPDADANAASDSNGDAIDRDLCPLHR
jgi:hypothetical protein